MDIFSAIHSNPTYVPYFITGFTDEMSMSQRAWNAYLKFSAFVMMKVLGWKLIMEIPIIKQYTSLNSKSYLPHVKLYHVHVL